MAIESFLCTNNNIYITHFVWLHWQKYWSMQYIGFTNSNILSIWNYIHISPIELVSLGHKFETVFIKYSAILFVGHQIDVVYRDPIFTQPILLLRTCKITVWSLHTDYTILLHTTIELL